MPRRTIPFETRVGVVEAYLFSDDSTGKTSERYRISTGVISNSYKDENVLRAVCERRGLTLEQVLDIKNKKLMSRGESTPRVTKEKYDRVIKLLESTTYPLKLIGHQVGSSPGTVKRLQNKAIEEGKLDPKYRRRRYGIVQWKYDEIPELLETTEYSLVQIGKEVGLSGAVVARLQNQAIEDGTLYPKYRRLLGDVIQWQYDRSLELLKTTRLTLHEIGKEVGLSDGAIRKVQNQAIEDGKLDLVYRRLVTGTLQLTYDRTIELLKETDWTLTKIGEEVGLASSTMTRLQSRAIEGGRLDSSRRRPFNPIRDAPSFREFIESDETAQMFVRVLGGSPAALGRALSIKYQGRLVAEDVPDYLPSLGPYLGTITVSPPPPSPGGFGDVLIELPLEAILEDQLLRDTFLNMGREYYFSLIESEHPTQEDRQTLVDVIKSNAEEADHPSLKWLHQTLFDEFSRFHELARELAEIKAKINGDN